MTVPGDTVPAPARGWARSCWAAAEPFTLGTMFGPEARAAAKAAGLSGLSGFVVMRAAPMGAAAPAVVKAAFHGFPDATMTAVFPGCWQELTPEQAIDVTHTSVTATCTRLFADTLSDQHLGAEQLAAVPALADRLTGIVAGLDTSGRPLAAGNQAVRPPADPWARLWRAMTTLREYRGDGHVAALTSAGLDRVEALVLMAAWAGDDVDTTMLRRTRQLDDAVWAAGQERLRARGLLGPDGALSTAGKQLREGIEEATDQAAAPPWLALGPEGVREFYDLAVELSTGILHAGLMRPVTAVGAPWPPTPPVL